MGLIRLIIALALIGTGGYQFFKVLPRVIAMIKLGTALLSFGFPISYIYKTVAAEICILFLFSLFLLGVGTYLMISDKNIKDYF